ncbi:MAG: hypothetical protein A2V90_08675 [Gammaproteobacteria bacterium RBG_16_57_12]|nr:MAG: hypothetical protein A2V90_08675 [Gammaproteobacteria bacterium RBG_16_57_12]
MTDVVLEFDWAHLAALYKIDISRKEFDRRLREAGEPHYIRKMRGRYFAHGSPCPAYDSQGKGCRVYGTALKPDNCSDFPVYFDGDEIVADTRCEAMNVQELLNYLHPAVSELELHHAVDRDFPVINRITFSKRRA